MSGKGCISKLSHILKNLCEPLCLLRVSLCNNFTELHREDTELHREKYNFSLRQFEMHPIEKIA